MDNHKPVTISIFGFLNMKKMQFFFVKNMLKKLGFGLMHENNFFFWNISEKTGYFNTGLVFYSVNIQPDII
jgi:hypothetical protein